MDFSALFTCSGSFAFVQMVENKVELQEAAVEVAQQILDVQVNAEGALKWSFFNFPPSAGTFEMIKCSKLYASPLSFCFLKRCNAVNKYKENKMHSFTNL